jgi:hypothetical protein
MSTGRDMWEMAVEATVEAVNATIFDIEEGQRGNADAVRVPVVMARAMFDIAAREAAWDTSAFATFTQDVQAVINQTFEGSPIWRVMSAVAGAMEETRAQRNDAIENWRWR